MSIGSIIGGVLGAIVGFIYGGPVGAAYGFVIGFGLGMMVDPMRPDVSQPGVPIQQLQMPDNTIGTVIPDVLGTAKIAGTFLCFGNEKAIPQYQEASGGKGGGGSQSQQTGYKYYMDWAQGICLGPVDTLYAIYKNNDELLWEGELNRPESGGKETIALGAAYRVGPSNLIAYTVPVGFKPEMAQSSIDFYFGTDDQLAGATVASIIGDATLNSPMRGLCYAVMKNFYIGEYNRCPALKFVLKKTPALSALPANRKIGFFDYNPAHGIWYILNNMVDLPASWLHTESFAAVAATLKSEGFGISMCFDQHQTALTYLEAINSHVDNIIKYGSDGKFHLKLIRGDYDAATLPLVDENIVLEDPAMTRKSWIDTINEIKVQYSEIYGFPYSWYKGYISAIGTTYADLWLDSLIFWNETIAVMSITTTAYRQVQSGGTGVSKGYFAGGSSDKIDGLTYADETIAQLVSVLSRSDGAGSPGGTQSPLKVYFGGGAGTNKKIIDALRLSDETCSRVVATLPFDAWSPHAAQSGAKAYFSGTTIQSLRFSNETTEAISSITTPLLRFRGATSSPTKGYFAGGDDPATSTAYKIIESIIYATELRVILSAELTTARSGAAGCYDIYKGYYIGGTVSGAGTKLIDALRFADETLYLSSAELSYARWQHGTLSMPIK